MQWPNLLSSLLTRPPKMDLLLGATLVDRCCTVPHEHMLYCTVPSLFCNRTLLANTSSLLTSFFPWWH